MGAPQHYGLWFDKRLADVYDLIAEIVEDHATEHDSLPEIRALLIEIEKADRFLAGLVRDRTGA